MEAYGSVFATYLYLLQAAAPAATSPVLWTQLLTALVVGLLTALGFQVVMTNLGVVLGVSALVEHLRQPPGSPESPAEPTTERPTPSSRIVPTLGFGLLLTVNLVLFAACFLGTRFSQVADPMSGAIAGLTIWSAYLLILLWVSTRTLNSVAGFMFDRATGGMRWAMGAIASLFKEDPPDPISEENIRNLIRGELQEAINGAEMQHLLAMQVQALTASPFQQGVVRESEPPSNPYYVSTRVWQPVKTYLTETSPKSLTPKRVHRKLEKLVQSIEADLPEHQALPTLQTDMVSHWLEQRDDLSDKKKQRILGEVKSIWKGIETGSADNESVDAMDVEVDGNWDEEDDSETQQASLQEKLQAALRETLDQTLGRLDLSGFLGNTNASVNYVLGAVLIALAEALPRLSKAGSFPDAISLNVEELKPDVNVVLDKTRTQLTNLGQSSLQQVEQAQNKVLQSFDKTQHRIQAKIDHLKQQAYEQAEAAQKNAIKALWWLFAIALTGAISSALAGVIATHSLQILG